MPLHLGVNIDHIATLRQARYRTMPGAHNVEPSILQAALEAEAAGAHSITVHLRADRRHIVDEDVFLLRREIGTMTEGIIYREGKCNRVVFRNFFIIIRNIYVFIYF